MDYGYGQAYERYKELPKRIVTWPSVSSWQVRQFEEVPGEPVALIFVD